MADPLFDTLFRSTARPAGPPPIASAAPVRETGTRTRAGNAMNRTRAALLDGARRAVESSGTKITMAQVAAAAGVAKATLYNHFRTREAVLDALRARRGRAGSSERAAGPAARRRARRDGRGAVRQPAAARAGAGRAGDGRRARPHRPHRDRLAARPRRRRRRAGRRRARRRRLRAALAGVLRAQPGPSGRASPPIWPCSSRRCPTLPATAEVAASA